MRKLLVTPLLVTAAVLSVTGCIPSTYRQSDQLSITVASSPEGARIYCQKKDSTWVSFGYAPVIVEFLISADDQRTGNIRTDACKAEWVSGAYTVTHFTGKVSAGTQQNAVIKRPQNAPGLEHDVQFASDFVRQRSIARQAQQENRDDTTTHIINGAANALDAYNQERVDTYRQMNNAYQQNQMQSPTYSNTINCVGRIQQGLSNAKGQRSVTGFTADCH